MTILKIGSNLVRQFTQHTGKEKNRKTNRGFTFFEIMVTVAILSFGIVMVFQAFLTSLNAFSYYMTHLQVQCLADEKIWEVSDKFDG